jgi:biopolymer transport protein TolR
MPRRTRRTRTRPVGAAPEISITSMIDVMMALLIIFLVIQPALRRGLDVQLPTTEPPVRPPSEALDQLVLEVGPDAQLALNAEPVEPRQLGTVLRAVFRDRVRRVLFVKGSRGVTYGEVMSAVDSARGAGVTVIGFVPKVE